MSSVSASTWLTTIWPTLAPIRTFDIDSLGIGPFRAISDGNRKLTPRETGVPLITQFTIGDRDTGNGLDRMKQLQFADNFSIHHDRHNFKMGGEYQRVDMNRASANNPRGALTFNANQGGYDFASLLLGYPSSVHLARGAASHHACGESMGRLFPGRLESLLPAYLEPGTAMGLLRRADRSGRSLEDSLVRLICTQRPMERRSRPSFPCRSVPAALSSCGSRKSASSCRASASPTGPGTKWVIRSGAGWFADVEHLNTFTILANMPPFGEQPAIRRRDRPGQNRSGHSQSAPITASPPAVSSRQPDRQLRQSLRRQCEIRPVESALHSAESPESEPVAVEPGYSARIAPVDGADGRVRGQQIQQRGQHGRQFQQPGSIARHEFSAAASLSAVL